MKRKNILALLLALSLCLGLLAGCGGSKEEPKAEEAPAQAEEAPAETEETPAEVEEPAGEDAGEAELQEYEAEGVGTFYLPAGWEMETGSDAEPLPRAYADFTSGDIHIQGIRFGADAYEAAGVPLPADVEEYSQREGVRRGLPEDAVFDYDEFGNYYVEYTEDGTVIYHVLKQGQDSMGDVILSYPEGTDLPEGILQWISQAALA